MGEIREMHSYKYVFLYNISLLNFYETQYCKWFQGFYRLFFVEWFMHLMRFKYPNKASCLLANFIVLSMHKSNWLNDPS